MTLCVSTVAYTFYCFLVMYHSCDVWFLLQLVRFRIVFISCSLVTKCFS